MYTGSVGVCVPVTFVRPKTAGRRRRKERRGGGGGAERKERRGGVSESYATTPRG